MVRSSHEKAIAVRSDGAFRVKNRIKWVGKSNSKTAIQQIKRPLKYLTIGF